MQILGSSPGQTNKITFVMYVAAVAFAQHSVHLTHAYFIPDDQILAAFTDAARRGVDVKLILPATTDSRLALSAQRYNYSELLKAGVRRCTSAAPSCPALFASLLPSPSRSPPSRPTGGISTCPC